VVNLEGGGASVWPDIAGRREIVNELWEQIQCQKQQIAFLYGYIQCSSNFSGAYESNSSREGKKVRLEQDIPMSITRVKAVVGEAVGRAIEEADNKVNITRVQAIVDDAVGRALEEVDNTIGIAVSTCCPEEAFEGVMSAIPSLSDIDSLVAKKIQNMVPSVAGLIAEQVKQSQAMARSPEAEKDAAELEVPDQDCNATVKEVVDPLVHQHVQLQYLSKVTLNRKIAYVLDSITGPTCCLCP